MEETNAHADKDTPQQRRPITCERCTRLKTRCDRQAPSCKRCSDAQLPCDYSSRRKPGFPAGYRQVLEDRIDALQAEVEAFRSKARDNGREITTESSVSGSLTLNVANPGSSLSPSASIGSKARSAVEYIPPATCYRTKQVAEEKPPADLVFSLVSLHFLHIHPWMPFLDIQRIFRELGKGNEPPPLCHALFGLSLPFSFDSRLTQNACDSYWKYSKRRILIGVLEEPSYSSLESLAILVLDLSGMTNGPQVWGALAIAVKLAIQLKTVDGQVLRACTTEQGAYSPQSVTSHRQKLFWVIYMVDSYISITTNHPSGLADYHISYFLPTRDLVWMIDEAENEMAPGVLSLESVFKYQLRLMDVSRMLHSAYISFCSLPRKDEMHISSWLEQVEECSKQLDDWAKDLPATASANPARAAPSEKTTTWASITMMHTYYRALVIFLHGLVSFPTRPELQNHFEIHGSSSREKCSSSVEAIVLIVCSIPTQSLSKLGWPLAWSIWVAGRYVLIAQSNGHPFPSHTIISFLQCLEQLAKYWQIAGKYWRILRQAYEEQQNGVVYESGVLPFVIDQTLATSALEDRFRVDSFFTDTTPNLNSATTGAIAMGFHSHSQQGAASSQPTQDLFIEEDDSWFLNPLNPSSAFQTSYPEFFDGHI